MRNVLIGLSFWGLLFANGLVHTAGGIAAGAYNTGLWERRVPVCSIVHLGRLCVQQAIRGPYAGKVVGMAYAAGAVTHVLLFSGLTRLATQECSAMQAFWVCCRRDRFRADHLGGHRGTDLQA